MSLPKILTTKRQWVGVKKNSKIPINLNNGAYASSSNKNTWSTYDNAISKLKKGIIDNIGYVFNDDNIVGIDIDVGVDEYGLFNALTLDIVNACKSYTELSRSGRGVHIFVKGSLPFKGKNNRKGIEIYKSARFFIMTDKNIVYKDIIENQKAIDYIVDKYFKETHENRKINSTYELDYSKKDYDATIYSPIYKKITDNKINIKPKYSPITSGSRNISLCSIVGQLKSVGYTYEQALDEVLKINQSACDIPLELDEVISIVNSIYRY